MNSFYKYYLPAIIWALLIFFLSSLPSNAVQSLSLQLDDLILHFIEYSVFGILLGRSIIQNPHRVNWKLCLTVTLIGILYAASDEFHQMFVEGRFAEVSDFLADGVGVIFGLFIFIYVQKTF
ncbi:MAG: VanZ family protein [bacterium]